MPVGAKNVKKKKKKKPLQIVGKPFISRISSFLS